MSKIEKLTIGAAILSLFLAASAHAATPTLSLSSQGGASVEISVSGDPNSNVVFYYNVASVSGMQTMTLGATNGSGYFSTDINGSSYNINAGQSVYVIVDGEQSALQPWPTATGTPTLNQSSVTIGLGQSTSIYSTNGSAPIYMSTNSDPPVASFQANGNDITITGEQLGSTNASICYTGTDNDCVNLYVLVQAGSVLSFSENNMTLAVGQGATVTVTGGSGTYTVTGNASPSIASVSLSGNSIAVDALSAGNDTVSICDTSDNCGTLNVVVSGSTTSGGQLVFGVANPDVTVGETMSISLSGGGSYYVSSNANSNIAQPNINGSSLSLYGENVGSDSIVVCVSGGSCNTLYVTVTSESSPTVSTSNTSSLFAAIQSMQSQLAQIVTQIQSMTATLSELAESAGVTTTTSAPTVASTAPSTTFTEFLSVGSEDAQVTALQEYLMQKGFYSGPITGYYGSLTETAVTQYQTAHGIEPAGYVGPATRTALNAGE